MCMALFRVRDGFISAQVTPIQAEPGRRGLDGVTSAEITPSRTRNNTICIFSHDYTICEQNKKLLVFTSISWFPYAVFVYKCWRLSSAHTRRVLLRYYLISRLTRCHSEMITHCFLVNQQNVAMFISLYRLIQIEYTIDGLFICYMI